MQLLTLSPLYVRYCDNLVRRKLSEVGVFGVWFFDGCWSRSRKVKEQLQCYTVAKGNGHVVIIDDGLTNKQMEFYYVCFSFFTGLGLFVM